MGGNCADAGIILFRDVDYFIGRYWDNDDDGDLHHCGGIFLQYYLVF